MKRVLCVLGWKEGSHWVELSVENSRLAGRWSQGVMWAPPHTELVTSASFPSANLRLPKRSIDCPPSQGVCEAEWD